MRQPPGVLVETQLDPGRRALGDGAFAEITEGPFRDRGTMQLLSRAQAESLLGDFEERSLEAATWSAVWVGFAALFNVGVYAWFGADRELEFATGYVIEKALASAS